MASLTRIVLYCIVFDYIGEAGWTPDQWGHSRFRALNSSAEGPVNQKRLTAFMRALLKASKLSN